MKNVSNIAACNEYDIDCYRHPTWTSLDNITHLRALSQQENRRGMVGGIFSDDAYASLIGEGLIEIVQQVNLNDAQKFVFVGLSEKGCAALRCWELGFYATGNNQPEKKW